MVRSVEIPLAMLVVVDDVGWWDGTDGSEEGQPFRSGISRRHCLADYEALAELARALDMRIPIGMVLCEWDLQNVLRHIPSATWMGEAWNAPCPGRLELSQAADFLRSNRDSLDIALHGLAHEFWDDEGNMSRAEWADASGTMRSADLVRQHLDAFERILNQHRLGPFPTLYIPPDSRHCFGGKNGIARILQPFGVRWIVTPFANMKISREPEHRLFGVDHGIPTINRGYTNVRWNAMNADPRHMTAEWPIIGLHWANLLHPDSNRNSDVVAAWYHHLKGCESLNLYLARNMANCWSQLAQRTYTRLAWDADGVKLDFSQLLAADLPELEPHIRIRFAMDASDKVFEADLPRSSSTLQLDWQSIHAISRECKYARAN